MQTFIGLILSQILFSSTTPVSGQIPVTTGDIETYKVVYSIPVTVPAGAVIKAMGETEITRPDGIHGSAVAKIILSDTAAGTLGDQSSILISGGGGLTMPFDSGHGEMHAMLNRVGYYAAPQALTNKFINFIVKVQSSDAIEGQFMTIEIQNCKLVVEIYTPGITKGN